jgi:hypothetical protein
VNPFGHVEFALVASHNQSDFLHQNWGNVASVIGLVVSIATLVVANKARDAAEAAKALPDVRA